MPPPTPANASVAKSGSLILDSSHIVLIEVVAADFGPWKDLGNGTKERSGALTLRIDTIFKGAIKEQPGETFPLTVRQVGRVGSRYFGVPGLWSDLEIGVGTRLVTFSGGVGSQARELLQDPLLKRVLPADQAETDVRAAMHGEQGRLSVSQAVRSAASEKPRLGILYGDYLTARLKEILFLKWEEFDALMAFVEDPKLSSITRTVLFENIFTRVVDAENAPPTFPARIVLSGFRILRIPAAASLHGDLVREFLPGLLGVNDPIPRLTASEVFKLHPAERDLAEQALAGEAAPTKESAALLKWLRLRWPRGGPERP